MTLPVLNFAALPVHGDPLQAGLMSAIQEGMKTRYMPEMMKEQLRQQQLANALSQIQAQYAPQMTQAELAYKQQMAPHLAAQTGLTNEQAKYFGPTAQSEMALRAAQARLANQQANLPFGGHMLPGVAGDIQGLEAVKMMYGENSPQYQAAKDQFQLNQDSTRSRIGYQNILAQTLPNRALTPLGKAIVEESNVNAGNMPTGNAWGTQQQLPMQNMSSILSQAMNARQGQAPMAPASPQELGDQYNLLRQKNSSDVDTRKRNLFATNIEKTLNNINIDDLTQYAGIKGNIEMNHQRALAAAGKQSPQYEKFQKSLTASEFLASQIRQFYGDSIQPQMREKLEALTNPSTWTNNPKLAKEIFNQTKNILGQELQTYRDALKSPSAYQSPNIMNQQSASPSAAAIQQMAQDAIAKGANPQQVQVRIQQMLSGGGQ